MTVPLDIYSGVAVARIGYSGTGAYENQGPNNPWNGFIQSASGFSWSGGSPIANSGTFYHEYETDIFVPYAPSCNGNCNTLLWAGIGGETSQFFGGTITGNLIQSGFNIVGSGISNIQLYYEYANGWGTQVFNPPVGDKFAFNDLFTIWGWSASNSNCTHSTTGAVACFAFEDDTQGWSVNAPQSLPKRGGSWWPSTVEFIAEESSWSNANYGSDWMENGMGWDSNGTLHPSPASGTDPYVIGTTTGSSGNILNYATWKNGTFDTPEDPMVFIFHASN